MFLVSCRLIYWGACLQQVTVMSRCLRWTCSTTLPCCHLPRHAPLGCLVLSMAWPPTCKCCFSSADSSCWTVDVLTSGLYFRKISSRLLASCRKHFKSSYICISWCCRIHSHQLLPTNVEVGRERCWAVTVWLCCWDTAVENASVTYGYIAFCRCERDIMSYNLQYLTYWLRFVPTVYVIVVGEVELCLLSAVHMYRLKPIFFD